MFYAFKTTFFGGDYTNYHVTDTSFLTSGDVCWMAVSWISRSRIPLLKFSTSNLKFYFYITLLHLKL